MKKILKVLVYIFYPMCTPNGRQKRIEHLMQETGELREVCAAIVYTRDAKRVPFTFTDEEKQEAFYLLEMVKNSRIRLPADRE